MKKIFFISLLIGLVPVACATVNNLSEEEIKQLEVHTEEVQDKVEGQTKEDVLPADKNKKWIAPNYANQSNIPGYDATTFAIPEALKERVNFWIDIYTKYTTSQGIMHDSRFTHVVYEPIDFAHLDNDKSLSSNQRFKAEKKYLDERKKHIKEILLKLHELKDSAGLAGEELRYWKMFENVNEKDKFLNASQKGRLRFQLGQKDRFIQGIYYSGRYLKEMEKIFAEYNMPKELTRLPFVESSFNIKAKSKVGASGVWQFMRSTGKLYMKVNATIDERNDPIIAAHAAAKLLRQNYNVLESWPLAVTAYNYGAAGMKRIAEKAGTKDLAAIYGTNPTSRFGFASESFYTSYLAALEVEKNAEKYFGTTLKWADEVPYFEVKIQRPILFKELKGFHNNKDEDIINLNPHFSQTITRNIVKIPAGTKVRVPIEQEKAFAEYLARPSPRSVVEKEPVGSGSMVSYKVAKGDTLYDISKQFQISVDKIIQANQDINPSALRPGQTIEIPQ
ncbi:MAG: transglycosylase SLT domain-containing protein [Bdellovibrionota bacterium]